MKKHLFVLFLLNCIFSLFASGLETRFEGIYWVREYYNEVIQKKDRNVFFDYVPRFKERPFDFYEHLGYELYWYEELNRLGDVCHDFYFEQNDEYCLFLLRCSFAVEEITKLKDCYYRVITRDIKIDSVFIEDRMYEGCDWSLLKDKSEIQLYLEFDGEYLFIYADEAKTLLATYCMYEEDEYSSFLDAVATNNFDNMEFTFPRHADGSCDYDEGAWEAARKHGIGAPLRTGKATTVKENLRVHSFDSATSPVSITLAVGTPVEILGVGGEETIDGITSKWVHVRLRPGIVNSNGIKIKWAMGGWCFGGVVSDMEGMAESASETTNIEEAENAPATEERAESAEETSLPESTESETSNEEAESTDALAKENADLKQNAALPVVPIAAGVAALAILLAVILLAAKRKKSRQ